MSACTPLRTVALATTVLAAVVHTAEVRAQPEPQVPGWGFAWERVGDRPIRQFEHVTLGFEGRIWVIDNTGVADLQTRTGGVQEWGFYRYNTRDEAVVRNDTAWFAKPGTSPTGGGGVVLKTPAVPWCEFCNLNAGAPGGYLIRVAPATSTVPGRFFSSSVGSVGYSDGNGMPGTWIHAGVIANPEGRTSTFIDDIAFFPAPAHGGQYPDRVVGVGRWGAALSDDNGASWRASNLWQYIAQSPWGVLTLARPGGGTNVVAFGKLSGEGCGCTRVWLSEDGGETWRETAQLSDEQLAQGGAYATIPQAGQPFDVPSYDTPSALVAFNSGRMWQTDDGGQAWRVVGQVPMDVLGDEVRDIFLAPDRRLYASSIARRGRVDSAWVWRTALPFPIAEAPAPAEAVPAPFDLSIRPNPALGSARVAVGRRDGAARAVVEVFDVTGRRVALVYDGPLAPGSERTFEVDVGAWPAGAYTVRVVADGRYAAAPLTLVR